MSVRRSVLVDGVWTQETEGIKQYLREEQHKREERIKASSATKNIKRRLQERMKMVTNNEEPRGGEPKSREQDLGLEELKIFFKTTWGWRIVLNWMTEEPLTTWHGLQHDHLSHLTGIDLSGNNIIGELPPGFGSLRTLRTINLSDNKLTGSIPKAWGTLSELQVLNLSGNRLEGVVTGTLRKLSALRVLDVGGNWLDGAFPAWLDGLGNLEVLRGAMNDFTGPIPTTMVVSGLKAAVLLIGLKEISLQYNQLDGVIPQAIGNLTNLTSLDLESNQLRGQIPDSLGKIAALQSLNLRWNELTGPIPESLAGLTSLCVLRLNHNKLSGPLPVVLSGLTNLEELDVAGNLLEGHVPASYGQLVKMKVLALLWNELDVNQPTSGGAEARLALRKVLTPSCQLICVVEDADAEVIRMQQAQHESTRTWLKGRRLCGWKGAPVVEAASLASSNPGLLRDLSGRLKKGLSGMWKSSS